MNAEIMLATDNPTILITTMTLKSPDGKFLKVTSDKITAEPYEDGMRVEMKNVRVNDTAGRGKLEKLIGSELNSYRMEKEEGTYDDHRIMEVRFVDGSSRYAIIPLSDDKITHIIVSRKREEKQE